MTAPKCEWSIPPRVWAVLVSWGLAVLLLAGVFSYWVWSDSRSQQRDMCDLVAGILNGSTPVSGPAGDRPRSIQIRMQEWSTKRHCSSLIGRY